MEKEDLKEPLLRSSESVIDDFHRSFVNKGAKTKTVSLKIIPTKSSSSSSSLEAVIEGQRGVESVSASLVEGKVVIVYRPELVTVCQL